MSEEDKATLRGIREEIAEVFTCKGGWEALYSLDLFRSLHVGNADITEYLLELRKDVLDAVREDRPVSETDGRLAHTHRPGISLPLEQH